MTSARTIGRPAIISKPVGPFNVPAFIAKNAPAKPAMPADRANTASLVSSTKFATSGCSNEKVPPNPQHTAESAISVS